MSVLKRLREARGVSQHELARKIGVDEKIVEEWEQKPERMTPDGVSSISYYFGISSEEYLSFRKDEVTKLTTNCYYVSTDREIEDGWWGHLGVRLRGHKNSKWFPITVDTANRVTNTLSSIENRSEWIIVETLNNRVLIIKPSAVSRLWVLDENQDEPEGDWEITIDSYYGNPGELYKGLEDYCVDMGAESCMVSSMVMDEVERFTDVHDLGIDEVESLVFKTHIFTLSGAEESHHVRGHTLLSVLDEIEFDNESVLFDLSNEGYDLYIPTDDICLIDMPRRQVESAKHDIYMEIMAGGNEN